MTAVEYFVMVYRQGQGARFIPATSRFADTLAASESARPSVAYTAVYCGRHWLTTYRNGRRSGGASDL